LHSSDLKFKSRVSVLQYYPLWIDYHISIYIYRMPKRKAVALPPGQQTISFPAKKRHAPDGKEALPRKKPCIAPMPSAAQAAKQRQQRQQQGIREPRTLRSAGLPPRGPKHAAKNASSCKKATMTASKPLLSKPKKQVSKCSCQLMVAVGFLLYHLLRLTS